MIPASQPVSLVIAGWYGNENVGDEAILSQFLNAVGPGPDVHVTILPADFDRCYMMRDGAGVTVRRHHRLFGRGALKNLLRGRGREAVGIIRDCDILVVGGGSLIHDRLGLHALYPVVDDILVAKWLGKKVCTYALGIGPLTGRLPIWLARRALNGIDLLTLRDQASADLARRLGITAGNSHVVADPGLLLPDYPLCDQRNPLTALPEDGSPRVGVFPCPPPGFTLAQTEQFCAGIAAALDRLHEVGGFRFVLLPMATMPGIDDRVIARRISRHMAHAEAALVVETPIRPEEMKGLIGRMSFNISMRLHSAIFSVAGGVPVTAISYDPKVRAFMTDVGLASCVVDLKLDIREELVACVAAMVARAESHRRALSQALPALRTSARRFFSELDALIAQTRREKAGLAKGERPASSDQGTAMRPPLEAKRDSPS